MLLKHSYLGAEEGQPPSGSEPGIVAGPSHSALASRVMIPTPTKPLTSTNRSMFSFPCFMVFSVHICLVGTRSGLSQSKSPDLATQGWSLDIDS